MRVLFAVFGLWMVALVQSATASTPTQLESWRSWVLRDMEFRACPLIAGRNGATREDYVCAWPGTLTIEAFVKGAVFSQRWRVDTDGWVPLPGDRKNWPLDVTVNNQFVAVLERQEPRIWLKAGTHEVRGRFAWDERPQTLQIPIAIGLVALTVDGKALTPVQRTGDKLTLGRGVSVAVEADSVDLKVFRKFSDGIPALLTTIIQINASGQAREEVFGPALPEGYIPLTLESDEWPARLGDDGRLSVQVQPGSNQIELIARQTESAHRLLTRISDDWVTQEIWSYESAPELRVTHVTGAVQVDPQHADVPSDWSEFPAFAMGKDDVLVIEERSRGLDPELSNRLTLHREAWLDFSGDRWFTRDRIQGRMENDWRLDALAPFRVQRATAHGTTQSSLLVTRGSTAESSGVEWHAPNVNLVAGLQIDRGAGRMPVTGWQQTFDEVSSILHLPYGYRLIAAPGADRASGSWLSRWSLLDVFLVAVIVLIATRHLGKLAGAAVAIYLLLGYHESGSPLWLLLTVLVVSMVARYLPDGRLARVAHIVRAVVLLVLVIVSLPFATNQLRQSIYPQLEGLSSGDFDFAGEQVYRAAEAPVASEVIPPPPPPPPHPMPGGAPMPQSAISSDEVDAYSRKSRTEANDKLQSVVVTGSRIRKSDLMGQYSESTVVQTGAGAPAWQIGKRYVLHWAGPVLADQEVNLVIASPWMIRLLRVLMIASLAWVLWQLARRLQWPRPPLLTKGLASALVIGAMVLSTNAIAEDYPTDSLLQQLRERLLKQPDCLPLCANVAQARVFATAEGLRATLDVHVGHDSVIALPMDERALAMRSIKVNGVATDGVIRINNRPSIRVARGVQRVEISYAISGDRIALAFPMAPYLIAFEGDTWQASGLADQRLLTETLSIVRVRSDDSAPSAEVAQQFPPFVKLVRDVSLDLQWRVANEVTRMAPETGGFTIDLPILSGERVESAGIKLREGKVTMSFPDKRTITRWASVLDQAESLKLTAPAMSGHTEVWKFTVSPTWHVEFEGVPQSAPSEGADDDDFRTFEFHPLPGETLTVRVTKPVALEGATRAVDSVRVASELGERARTYTVSLSMRASQGGEQSFVLPEGAEVLGVSRNGANIGLRANNGRLSLPVTPGEQNFEIRLRENQPVGFKTTTPAFALGLPSANIDLHVSLPNDRWLLAAFGPPVGPAVLFWGELLVAIVLAWLLSRVWRGDFRFHQGLLLVLGFSTFSWIALAVVIAWLYVIEWRRRRVIATPWKFNLVQVGIAALTLIALVCLVASIENGLLGQPDMMVSGANSYGNLLNWFADRSSDVLPTATVISLPLWTYNVMMLLWALWLAWALVGWLRKGFAAWTSNGYWRALPRKIKPVQVDVPDAPPPPPVE